MKISMIRGNFIGVKVVENDRQSSEWLNEKIAKELLDLIPRSFALEHTVIPIRRDSNNQLHVAINNPFNFSALNDLRLKTGMLIIPQKANGADIHQAIIREYPSEININEFGDGEIEAETNEEQEDTPIIKLVNSLIQEAINHQASDIHFDPQEKFVSVRMRVDGVLREIEKLPKNIQPSVNSRLKIISDLDITENRVPQDGSAQMKTGKRIIDLRLSILPTIHGEKVVIRIMDRSIGIRNLEDFNFKKERLVLFRQLLAQPHGIILVTGPTGSGKSSTLYAALNELNDPKRNLITVEDPVEYQLGGINQVAVNASIGMTFSSTLRAMLRQDPDIIMVGEIRDSETAEIAIRASMTGHLVLSTIHTNDSVTTISRLIDMEIPPFLVANSLTGILSQRLVRTVCQNCKTAYPISEEEKVILNRYGRTSEQLYRGQGCVKCAYTGYAGRIAIQELLIVTAAMRKMITENVNSDEMIRYLKQKGMPFLADDAIDKVIAGFTTIEEGMKIIATEGSLVNE